MSDAKNGLTKPLAKYSHCRRVGDLLLIAGQGCRDPKTNIWAGVEFGSKNEILSIDFAAQVKGVLRNIEDVLRSQGLTRSHLVDVQVFLTDMKEQFDQMNQIWNEFFESVENPPTRTTVAVKGLPGHNLIEMKSFASFKV
ncbi:MAG: RidA family protein [Proteobacteria bacterium]|nr:RidA family protein [Pseudomonadota bacterium]